MATSDKNFWKHQQGAARFKHRVLKNQLGAFAGMAGSTSESGRVVYLDGYAGPGAYDDGVPGSPQLALEVAHALSGLRRLHGYFIELKSKQAKKLRTVVEAAEVEGWKVMQGSCEEHLGSVILEAGEDPLLVFLDPYGLAIPLELFRDQILGRPLIRRNQVLRKTEVILNFSLPAITRLAGFLDKNYRANSGLLDEDTHAALREGRTLDQLEQQRDDIVEKLDAFLGGNWWHGAKRASQPGWQKSILDEWVYRAIADHPGWTTVPIPVSDTWNGPPAFYLVLFSRSPYGVHQFIDGVSRAYEHMVNETYHDADNATRLFALEEAKPADFADALVNELVEHLRTVIQGGLRGRVLDLQLELYGPTLGRARAKHLRRALQQLEGELIRGPIPPANKLLSFDVTPR